MHTFTRRRFMRSTALATAAAALPSLAAGQPLILDTDIGDDIDDTWAMLLLLRMPALDVQLAVGDFGNALYRARLLAKLLEVTTRTDIPIGIGLGKENNPGNQSDWLGNYRLADFPGTLHEDGVQAIIDTVMGSAEPVTLLCLGPVPNIAEALRREPRIADNAHVVGMYGSIDIGYDGEPGAVAEWNVRSDPASLQAVFRAPWNITITPLDTCGLVTLDGERFGTLYCNDDPWLDALMENYAAWLPTSPYMDPDTDPTKTSSTLFDTVAVYLAAERNLVEMKALPLTITDDGYTIIDEQSGRMVDCAIGWKNLDAFKNLLVKTLLA